MSIALLTLLPQLVASGIADAAAIKGMFASSNPALTDADLNLLCDMVIAKATLHKALALADAGKA
jgi:hypothetical protein